MVAAVKKNGLVEIILIFVSILKIYQNSHLDLKVSLHVPSTKVLENPTASVFYTDDGKSSFL